MKKLVLTGGPSSGKSTVLARIKNHFKGEAIIVPETASLLLNGGYPAPGELFQYTPEWHLDFEDAIFHVQKSIEKAAIMVAENCNAGLIIFDRGMLDIAAHLPGGVQQFYNRYGQTEEESLNCYDAVVHLVSLVKLDLATYTRVAIKRWGNSHLASAGYATGVEEQILLAWANHKNRFIIDGNGKIGQKTIEVLEIIKRLIA